MSVRQHGLAAAAGDKRKQCVWSQAQMGVVYFSHYATFAGFFVQRGKTLTQSMVSSCMKDIYSQYPCTPEQLTSATVGLSFDVFKAWCEEKGTEPPKGMQYRFPTELRGRETSNVFERSYGHFQDSAADLFFHIKSKYADDCDEVLKIIKKSQLGAVIDWKKSVIQKTASKQQGERGGVLGCRFHENLNNPADPVTLASRTLIGHEDASHLGGTFVLAQRFTINWEQLHNMSDEEIEDIIGRTTGKNYILPSEDTRFHIKCARGRDAEGNTTPVLRLGLPFGRRFEAGHITPDLAMKGANFADEEGIYFAGYTQAVQNLEVIMDQMIGTKPGFMRDRLFDNLKSDFGGYFYIPSYADLGMDPLSFAKDKKVKNWKEHPGMDWSRLSTHYKKSSKNGLMHYNHIEYMNAMGTMSHEEALEKLPPSSRVLELLSHSFSIWQDNWYFNRKQPEFKHMREYITEFYGPAKASEVMKLNVMERKGWAIKMTLKVVASHSYGHRGTTWIENGEERTGPEGSNTYTIHPSEVIVGQLPNLSLGQGRYAMVYETEAEHMGNYMSGCNEASGLGHVVPSHKKLLALGLDGIRQEARDKLTKEANNMPDEMKAFLSSTIMTLDGVSEYCMSFARLASEVKNRLSSTQTEEKLNLEEIEERLKKIAYAKPETFLDALQLVFVMHCCLHLTGEPVAVGRLDQLLYPFYKRDLEKGLIDEDIAQEALDCFWIKMDEKVQQNRTHVEDHQKLGFLMPGPPGGTYPKASMNQWVQQVTVGGYVANDKAEPESACNTITKLALRCARRLPLNAPCLSFRVNPLTPKEYLEEAAKSVLSGGAHPFFINDEKITKGLHESGDDISPTKKVLKECYSGKVKLEDARDFACDGCYEPLFSGKNHFTLGTMQLLEVLEAVMNNGKKYTQAGPNFLRGGVVTEPCPSGLELPTFDDFKRSFFKQFELVHKRFASYLLGGYNSRESACPTPLLSAVTDSCITKGRDLYNGGGQYNVVSLCLVGMPTVVNAMYTIKKLVYDEDTAVTSLPELVECLICDWGHKMVEPFQSALLGAGRTATRADRWKRLRSIADGLPKFGRGDKCVDELAHEVIGKLCDITLNEYRGPGLKDMIDKYTEQYGTAEHPWGGFQVQVGCATFENYVGFGIGAGASADGRRNNQTLASDLSPTPSLVDEPVKHQPCPFAAALKGYTSKNIDKLTQGAMTDFNIEEMFPVPDLVEVLQLFANGAGPNMMTITTADPATFEEACRDPEGYDLLRVRMGGWTEFFTSLNPDNQEQHRRRPLSTPGPVGLHLRSTRQQRAAITGSDTSVTAPNLGTTAAPSDATDAMLSALKTTTTALSELTKRIGDLEEQVSKPRKVAKKKKKTTKKKTTKKAAPKPVLRTSY